MSSDACRVGAALAYLVRRMEAFCGVSGADVLLYKPGDLGGIPRRMPAADVLKAQARHYPTHRARYPDDLRTVLDAGTDSVADPQAYAGFINALSLPVV